MTHVIFPVLLALLLAGDAYAQGAASGAAPALAAAIQLADEARDADALAAFRQLASANPNDHVARLWIARLHVRMDNPELAEPVYRSILIEDPANFEARLGLAATLLTLYESERALEVLEPAEEQAPQDPIVLTLLARAHRQEGRTRRALDYYERAVAVDPGEEYQAAAEAMRAAYAHRIETRGFSEQYNGSTPDSRSGEVLLNYRLSETWRVFGRGQVQRKFAVSEHRAGGGVEWQWSPDLTLRGHALVGPDNIVMPEGDYLGELEYAYGRATWSLALRHFDFTGARTFVFSPAVTWAASDRLVFSARYAASSTEANTFASNQTGHSAHLRSDYRLRRRVWVHLGYAAGVEDFESFSIDRIGDFRANAASGGLRIDLPTLTSVLAGYEHQWRSRGVNMGRVRLALQQRF